MIDYKAMGFSESLYEAVKGKIIHLQSIVNVKHIPLHKGVEYIREPHPTFPRRMVVVGQRIKWEHRFQLDEKRHLFGESLFMMILFYIKEWNYRLEKEKDGVFYFTNLLDTVVYDSVNEFFGRLDEREEFIFTWKHTTNKITSIEQITLSKSELATALKTTEAKLDYSLAADYLTKTVESDLHVWSAYSTLSIEDNVVNGDFMINDKSWTEYSRFGDLVFPFGKAGQDFCVDWVLYNEHTDETPDWYSEGNFGEGARVRISDKKDPRAFSVNVWFTDGEPYYDGETHTFYYNESKEALLAIQPTLLPAQGKNSDHECIIDLKTGKIYYSRFEAMKEAV